MNPNLLFLPAFVCLTIGAYLAWSVFHDLRAGALSWRDPEAKSWATTVSGCAVATTIAATPPALWLAAWVIGGAP